MERHDRRHAALQGNTPSSLELSSGVWIRCHTLQYYLEEGGGVEQSPVSTETDDQVDAVGDIVITCRKTETLLWSFKNRLCLRITTQVVAQRLQIGVLGSNSLYGAV